MTGLDVRFVENWLRVHGLPQMLPRSVRRRALLRRSAPLLAALLVMDTAFTWALTVFDRLSQEAVEVSTRELTAMILLVTAPLVACVVAALVHWAVRRAGLGQVLATVVALAWVLVPWVQTRFVGERPLSRGVPTRLWVLAAVVALVYLGVGTIVTWAVKRSVSEITAIGAMSARILPVFLIAVLFLFFNAEIWQVCNGLDNGRAIAVAAILLALAIVVVVVTALDEIQELIEARSDVVDEADQRRLLAATPLVSYPVPSRRDPLGLGERINVVVLAVAVQVFQVIMFSLVMGLFFVGFGQLAITDQVAKAWTATDLVPISFEGIDLPISTVLAKVSLVLSCFSGLSFAASSSSNSLYRKTFLEPILAESLVNLAARDAYRHLRALPDQPSTPPRQEGPGAPVADAEVSGPPKPAARRLPALQWRPRGATAAKPPAPKHGLEPGAGSAHCPREP
ncbi:MAG: hypothetical protein LCH98_08730 [Actinobacteria bacterium]|nr:hypothetical protein [Actinomycetota bacterium]